MTTISPMYGKIKHGSYPVSSDSIRLFLSNISDKNILENIFKRSVSSINSLENALLDERHRTKKLLYEKRRLELLLARNLRRRKTHQLRQNAVRVAQKVVNATEYYAASLSNAAVNSLDNLTQSSAWSIISSWEKSSDENKQDIKNEKNIGNLDTKSPKDSNMDITHNLIKPNHGYNISNEPFIQNQIEGSTENLPMEVVKKSDEDVPQLQHLSTSETSQSKVIVIMEVAFELQFTKHKQKIKPLKINAVETIQDSIEEWAKTSPITFDQKQKLIARLELEEENATTFPTCITITDSDLL